MATSIAKLNSAIHEGNIDEVRECLADIVDVNQKAHGAWRPIDWISRIKAEAAIAHEIVTLLLDKGADPLSESFNGEYIFADILRKKKHGVFKTILSHFINKLLALSEIKLGEIPLLFYTIKFGELEDVKILFTCFRKEFFKISDDQLLLMEFDGKIPLFYALQERKNIQLIDYLIEESFTHLDLEDEEVLAIQNYLVEFDDYGEVLENFINNYSLSLTYANEQNENYLHFAAKQNRLILVNLFIDSELDVNQQNIDGDTPLILAIKTIDKKLSFYQDNGHEAEHDEDDSEDEGEEHSTSSEPDIIDNICIIKKFILKGADVTLVNHKNQSALSILERLPKKLNLEAIINKCVELYKLKNDYFYYCEKIKEKEPDFVNNDLLAPEIINFINHKIEVYVDDDEDLELDEAAQAKLKEILRKIADLPYADYYYVKIREIILKILSPQNKQPAIHDRFNKEVHDTLPEAEKYYYTFLPKYSSPFVPRVYVPYKLTLKEESPPDYYLMTTLVYEGIRHENYENQSGYQLLRRLIVKINSQYKDFSLKQFNERLITIETENKNFFGENVSDDSDSEQESEYKRLPQRKKHFTHAYVESFFKKSQPERLFVKKDGKLKSSVEKIKYDIAKRQEIHREMVDVQTQRDLERLNMLAIRNELDEETVKMISTKFCVAQYRGISYRVDHWNKPGRKKHRELDEKGQPLFSPAVISLGGYKTYGEYVDAVEKNPDTTDHLIRVADNLKAQLLQLQKSGPVTVKFSHGKNVYDNALLALQAVYTNGYEEFHRLLKIFSDKFITHEFVKLDSLEEAILLSLNNKLNPFTSTSETPDHALRYSYGDKFYDSYKDKRLRPRWNADGKCERPYSGKVYISLHDPLELVTGSHHVVSLVNKGKIPVGHRIMSEREMSFLSYIPAGRVVSQHVAKFPSFRGEYKEIYFEKYGLNKELYDQFKDSIMNSAPHSAANKAAKRLLTAHLISYHEVCLIEEAKIAANNSGRVLIYRNEYGGFSLIPNRPFEPGNDKKRKPAIAQSNQYKKQKRIETLDEGNGFLTKLTQDFTCSSDGIPENSLIKSLSILSDIPIDQLTDIKNDIPKNDDDHHLFLEKICDTYNISIYLHSPMYENFIKKIGAVQEQRVFHLYHLGGNFFSALEPKKTDQRTLKRAPFFKEPEPKRQAQMLPPHVESSEISMEASNISNSNPSLS